MNVKADRKTTYVLIGVLVGLVVGVEFSQFSASRSCPKEPCIDGVKITPVTDREYGPAVLKLIRNADKSILIMSMELKYYEKYPHSGMNDIVAAIVDAHERGVDVRIIIDEYSRENNAFDLLNSSGIDIRWDDDKTTTHSKIVIVDGKVVLLGSSNFSFYSLEKNREANVLIEDEGLAQYYSEYIESYL